MKLILEFHRQYPEETKLLRGEYKKTGTQKNTFGIMSYVYVKNINYILVLIKDTPCN